MNINDYTFEDTDETADMKHLDKKCFIILQQRNARQSLTIIYNLDDDLDAVKIMKAMQRKFACSGAVKNDKKYGQIIQLQGDQRYAAAEWLYYHEVYDRKEARIVIQGA
jgi:translation initiation factor SUI1